jgi:hypothetical protein
MHKIMSSLRLFYAVSMITVDFAATLKIIYEQGNRHLQFFKRKKKKTEKTNRLFDIEKISVTIKNQM